MNVEDAALTYLTKHGSEMVAKEEEESRKAALRKAEVRFWYPAEMCLMARSQGGGDADNEEEVQGLYRDPMNVVVVNLQTAEVYLQNRMLMPVPTDIRYRLNSLCIRDQTQAWPDSAHADFLDVFQGGNMFCAVASSNVNCRKISIMHDNRVFSVTAWKPLKSVD